MSLGHLAAAAVIGAAALGAAEASTFTFNDGHAHCAPAGVASPCADTHDGSVAVAAQLAAGAVFGFNSPSFVDTFGRSFAARVTVVATGTPANRPLGEPAPSFTSNTVSGSNSWIHLRFEFVDFFDVATRGFGAARTVSGLRQIAVDDIDSNAGVGRGSNFTDVAGINAPILALGSALEAAGFIDRDNNAAALPTTGFNYARMARTGDADGDGTLDNWMSAANVGSEADAVQKASVRAVYDATGIDLAGGFDFVWGSTSDVDFFRNTRGWNVSLVMDPSSVPLPASLPLLLAALAGVAVLKRRRRSD
jgi:hypothetical protein